MGYAAAIGALASIGGGAAAASNAPGATAKRRSPRKSLFAPQLLAFLQAGGDLGLLKVTRGGKNRKQLIGPDGKPVRRAETVKIGGERFLIGGAGRDIIGQQFDVAQKEAAAQTQKNFDMLFGENGPQFLKDRISDRPQQLRDAYGPAVSKGIREAIGGAAPAGTLTTDAILQRVSAPVAFQAESMFQQAEDVRNAQQLGLAGVPGFGTGFPSNPNNFVQPQGLSFLQSLGFQSAGINQFNTAQRNQSQGFKSGLYAGSGGQIAGLFGQFANNGDET